MRDCESKAADKGGSNPREFVRKSTKDGSREDGGQDMGVESRDDKNLQKSERD